ncbi:hypothetical protein PR048_001842, partial [Dryococelus australis]
MKYNHAPMQQQMMDLVEIVAQVYPSLPVSHPTFQVYSLQCRPEKRGVEESSTRLRIEMEFPTLPLILVLLAIADANHHLILADFYTNRRISDCSVLHNTVFYEELTNGSLNMPSACEVTNSARKLPYVFVGDDSFPLRCDIVDKRIYNYRLSRTRREVENLFGLLAGHFRVFHTAINVELEHMDSIMKVCCALHNYLMTQTRHTYPQPETFDVEEVESGTVVSGLTIGKSNMLSVQKSRLSISPMNAKQVSNESVNYFVNEGKVPWQH